MRVFINIFLQFIFTISLFSQFKGDYGLYALGTADRETDIKIISLPFVNGVVIRFRWESLEPGPGKYNWKYIDHEIESARSLSKKAVLQMLGAPAWIHDSLGAEIYNYIDQNTYHTTYGDTLFGYIPWNEIYIQHVESIIRALGERYANDTTVTYVNAVSGSISRNLPEKTYDGKNFWEVYNYKPDTLIDKLKRVLDIYMKAFPKTPLWSSMDYVSFEKKATGKNPNYVCGEYAKYGVEKYPDRFGLWREDISGCTIYPPNSGSQWSVMNSYKERTGAQMLWSVQDGPMRMNQCGLSNSTKTGVMKAALDKGFVFGMRYFEIYSSDLKDTSLTALFEEYADTLRMRTGLTAIENRFNIPSLFSLEQNYPNPFNPHTVLSFQLSVNSYINLSIYNILGQRIRTLIDKDHSAGSYSIIWDAKDDNEINVAGGVYFYKLQAGKYSEMRKMIFLR